jgi:LPPG:FO 2-phospho-L-lactate transferase
MITVLAGGVGGGRFLQGLVQVVPPREVTVISNTGDDLEMFGLHVSPDIDIVTYHLAGLSPDEQGWGLAGDTFATLEALGRFGHPTWFHLGDRDLATNLHRTLLLRRGQTLSQATAEIARAFGLEVPILPVTDDRVRTRVVTDEGELDFQDYMVRRQADARVRGVQYEGVLEAKPAPGVIEAIMEAEGVILAPSNPIASIGPILAVPGVRGALVQTKARVAAVSPIVGGAVIKGPADKMLSGMGMEVSAWQVGWLYEDFLDCLVIDHADAGQERRIRGLGLDVVVTDTIMKDRERKAALARTVMDAIRREAK